ncbi:hypothetical protein ANCCAN_29946 [Ancylostoma caninum]|uniref:Uncharacterized protein n=1 Tax=Ancylostoma caninum TaxID=29170 RepID=A0A368EZX8_ANCCA|nr:hypothetical protein ANCCAN_29946 [Ancylostoma caninum]
MDDETKDIIDLLLCAYNEQPDDQYSPQQGTRANILSRENALDLSTVLRIKYPEIKLPTFSGDNDSCEEFWDTYSVIVDKNPQLGDLKKILYLKDALRKQALGAVKSISKKAEDYKLTVVILDEIFCNKINNRLVIVQRLTNVPATNKSAQRCASTLDEINQMVATGLDIRATDPLWVDSILSKFPYDVTKEIAFELHNSTTINTMQLGPIPAQCLRNAFCRGINHNRRDCRTVANAADRRKS